MLTFDPSARITVRQALEHPWLASYHDEADEPDCPETFEKWRKIEELETLEEFREALWNEIEDYRREVRGVNLDLSGLPIRRMSVSASGSKSDNESREPPPGVFEPDVIVEKAPEETEAETEGKTEFDVKEIEERDGNLAPPPPSQDHPRHLPTTPTDPVVTYARRSSIMQPSHNGSTFNSPLPSAQHLPTFTDGPINAEPGSVPPGGVVFPTQSYIVPARSRTASTAGGEVTRKLLRTLSTVSIHESAEGFAGGLAGIAPIGKYIVERQTTEADAPASEMPREFGIDETSEGEEDDGHGESEEREKDRKEGRFQIH